ncbi:MAG: hypothetical protein P8X49_01670 [Syntrophobacterales bacterium]|jgi:hypothetical protein
MPRKEKVLWLDDNCIFVALRETASEEPRMIILNHATGQHFKPEHESAQEVLNLLVKKTERDPGIHYKDLRKSMLNLFDLDENNVDGALITFLDKLDDFGVLAEGPGRHTGRFAPERTPKPWNGDVQPGGTLCCLGYSVTYYYWP